MKKVCSRCAGSFPANARYFSRQRSAKCGLSSRCKGCEPRKTTRRVRPGIEEIGRPWSIQRRKLLYGV